MAHDELKVLRSGKKPKKPKKPKKVKKVKKPKKKKAEVKLPAGCAEVGTSFKSMISEASDDMFQWMLDCISAEKKNRKARSNT